MTLPIRFENEPLSNANRELVSKHEPISFRTFTPSQIVIKKSAGVFHWTAEGRRLYDFTSGVLVANLGHNPVRWMNRWFELMGWGQFPAEGAYHPAMTMTSYNAVTELETAASKRLLESVNRTPRGQRLDTVVWAASGSEAVHKVLTACLSRTPGKEILLATRFGFHGKKGLAGAVTGSEKDPHRDPRVKFISFPMQEIAEAGVDPATVDLTPYARELEAMWQQYGDNICGVITEPYLGGGGSYHPPKEYHALLQAFCRKHDVPLIFDEVQANFGRTGKMYAFETYEVEPDFVVLGKGLGNGVPVAAVVGRKDIFQKQGYGENSDTWSGNPMACAAVLATLDEFEQTDVLTHAQSLTSLFLQRMSALKSTGLIQHVRGEGMVFGMQCAGFKQHSPQEVATAIVRHCYLGEAQGDGIHLLGALAGKVLRVSPPLTISRSEAEAGLSLLSRLVTDLSTKL